MVFNIDAEGKVNKYPGYAEKGEITLMEGVTEELWFRGWQDLNTGSWSGKGYLGSGFDFQGIVYGLSYAICFCGIPF